MGEFLRKVLWGIVITLLLWAGWGIWLDYRETNRFEARRAVDIALAQWRAVPDLIVDLATTISARADTTSPQPAAPEPAETSTGAPASSRPIMPAQPAGETTGRPDAGRSPLVTITPAPTRLPPVAVSPTAPALIPTPLPVPTAAPAATPVPPALFSYLVKHPVTGAEVALTKEQFDAFIRTGKIPETPETIVPLAAPSPAPPAESAAVSLPTLAPAPATAPAVADRVNTGAVVIPIQELARLVHELVNEEREKQGLAALAYDTDLAVIATAHSDDMAAYGYFSHVNPVGEDPTDRGVRQGYTCRKDYGRYYTYGLSENIYQGWLYDSVTYIGAAEIKDWLSVEELAAMAVQGWMDSPGHRANILNRSYDREGIGVAVSPDERVFFTQNFC